MPDSLNCSSRCSLVSGFDHILRNCSSLSYKSGIKPISFSKNCLVVSGLLVSGSIYRVSISITLNLRPEDNCITTFTGLGGVETPCMASLSVEFSLFSFPSQVLPPSVVPVSVPSGNPSHSSSKKRSVASSEKSIIVKKSFPSKSRVPLPTICLNSTMESTSRTKIIFRTLRASTPVVNI